MQLKRAVLCTLCLACHASAARPATSAKAAASGRAATEAAAMGPAKSAANMSKEKAAEKALPQLRSIIRPETADTAAAAGRNATQAAAIAPAKSAVNMSKEKVVENALPQLRSIVSPATDDEAVAAGRNATKAAAMAPAKAAANMSKEKATQHALPELRSIISPATDDEAAAAGHNATKVAAMAPAKSAVNMSKETAAQNGLSQLSAIMARAQSSLARVEKQHEKTVQKARSTVDDLFQAQAKFMGVQVAKYASALDQAAQQMSAVINASRAELAAEEQAEAKNSSIGWGGTAMEERARAGAKVDSAFRELGHLERQKDRDVEEAKRHALEPLDDAAQKLGHRVGDLSSFSDEAKASLEWAARRDGVGASIMDKLNVTKGAKGVERVLEAAHNVTAQKIMSADVAFAAALANATNVTEVGVNKIKQGLIESEKDEIKRVRR